MTRRHIEALAKALRGTGPDSDTHYNCCVAIANALADLNPSFDVKRFLRDCGVE